MVLQALDSYNSSHNTINNLEASGSGPAITFLSSLSPQLFRKYSLFNINQSNSTSRIKQKLVQSQPARIETISNFELSLNNLELTPSNLELTKQNLTAQIINNRIHSLSTLILQMPMSANNKLLQQLNMDMEARTELEKQSLVNNQQTRLELVDRKVFERGEASIQVIDSLQEILERTAAKQLNHKLTSLVTQQSKSINQTSELESIQQSVNIFNQKLFRSLNLTANLQSKLINEAYTTKIIHAFNQISSNNIEQILSGNNSSTIDSTTWIQSDKINYLQQNLADKIIRERIGETASVYKLIPAQEGNLLIHSQNPIMMINKLAENNNLLHKEKSNLKLIDRRLIDRGLQAAVTVIMLQQGAERRARSQILAEETIKTVATNTVFKQSAPILRAVINQINSEIAEKLTNNGLVISYNSSLSPQIYQRFQLRNNSSQQAESQQQKRKLIQRITNQVGTQNFKNVLTSVFNSRLEAETNSHIQNNLFDLHQELVFGSNESNMIYRENLTEKIVRERLEEFTQAVQTITLTKDNPISTQAMVQMVSQAQQELSQQLSVSEPPNEATGQTKRAHLVLVDRNYSETHIGETITKRLLQQESLDSARPALLTDRPVSMQSLVKNQINQRFIEKVTTQLINETQRTQSEALINQLNEVSQLVNRNSQRELAARGEPLISRLEQSEATIDYLKAKTSAQEVVQASVANVLNPTQLIEPANETKDNKVSPINKLEFDRIVDRVYKELQKRFTYERQRRGM